MKKSVLASIFAMAFLASASTTDAAGTQTKIDPITGFVKQGDFYPQAYNNMTRLELKLLKHLRKHLTFVFNLQYDTKGKSKPVRKQSVAAANWVPPVQGDALMSVKIGKDWVMLNFNGRLRKEGYRGEDFSGIEAEMGNETALFLQKELHRDDVNMNIWMVYDGYDGCHFYKDECIVYKPFKPTGFRQVPITGRILISAGHGYFAKTDATPLHKRTGAWDYQRDPSPFDSTYREDTATLNYANTLKTQIAFFAPTATVIMARNHSAVPTTYPSVPPPPPAWRNMAARYHLETILPRQGTAIWNRKPVSAQFQGADWEQGQDILSRPHYATFLQAKAMISIHTNAAPTAASHGGLVLYPSGRADSADFARRVALCLSILSQYTIGTTVYKYTAVARAIAGKAELDQFAGPNILVEVAFHTNKNDTTLLQYAPFRNDTMGAVAAGWYDFVTQSPSPHCG